MRSLRIHQTPLERGRLWVEIGAFLAAGIWAVYTFVYQTHIVPLLEPAHEVISGDVTRIGQTHGHYVERVQITLQNNGSVPVDTAGLAIDLLGLQDLSKVRTDRQHRNNVLIGETSRAPTDWRMLGNYADLFGASQDGAPSTHVILYPQDFARIQFLSIIPRGQYSALRLIADTSFVRYPTHEKIPERLERDANGALGLSSKPLSSAFQIHTEWYFPL